MRTIPGTPNHPVVQALQQDWHKIAAMIMVKLGVTHVEITVQDLERMTAPSASDDEVPTIIAHAKASAIHIRLMPMREAQAYAALHESGDV